MPSENPSSPTTTNTNPNAIPSLSSTPIYKPLLLPTTLSPTDSTTRDHLAHERTYLSWLRLAIYLSVVSLALILNFHLSSLSLSSLEKKLSLPLGLIFFLLALCCLGTGVGNYVKAVRHMGKRRAVVETGAKTQILVWAVALGIASCCVLLFVGDVLRAQEMGMSTSSTTIEGEKVVRRMVQVHALS